MKTKAALDMDNVILDLHDCWMPRVAAIIGRPISREELWSHNFHHVLQVDRSVIDSTYTVDLYDEALPLAGAVDGVRRLAEEYDIVICSTSPVEFDAVKTAWLERHFPGVALDLRYCRPQERKAKHVSDCAFLLDDYLKNFDGLPPSCRGIVYDQPWNRMDAFYPRAANWEAFLAMVGIPVAIS